jgi:hypothetical protein
VEEDVGADIGVAGRGSKAGVEIAKGFKHTLPCMCAAAATLEHLEFQTAK